MAIRWDEFKANFKHYDSILADNEPIVLPRREAARRAVNREKRSKIQFDCNPEQYALFHKELKRIREHCVNVTMATDVMNKWLKKLTPEIMDLIIEEGFDEAKG